MTRKLQLWLLELQGPLEPGDLLDLPVGLVLQPVPPEFSDKLDTSKSPELLHLTELESIYIYTSSYVSYGNPYCSQ